MALKSTIVKPLDTNSLYAMKSYRKSNPIRLAIFTGILALVGLLATSSLRAQDVPSPAPPHLGNLLLENAVIHVGNGLLIPQGNVLIVDDKIVAVGVTDFLPPNLERIDLAGKHIYPGLIAPITQLGLSEVEAARATNDRQEVGPINPNARAIVSYNTDSRVTPTVRSNGILLAQITPGGALLKGLSSFVHM